MSGVRLTENGVAGKQAKATERPTDWVGREGGRFLASGRTPEKLRRCLAAAAAKMEMDRRFSQDSHVLMLHKAVGLEWTGLDVPVEVPNVNKVRLVREYLSLSLSLSSSNVCLDLSTVTNDIDRRPSPPEVNTTSPSPSTPDDNREEEKSNCRPAKATATAESKSD